MQTGNVNIITRAKARLIKDTEVEPVKPQIACKTADLLYLQKDQLYLIQRKKHFDFLKVVRFWILYWKWDFVQTIDQGNTLEMTQELIKNSLLYPYH